MERSKALKGIFRWVKLHPYNISQKVQMVIEHYMQSVQPMLSGHAKAMVVVGSRLEAVRWQLAMQKYIKSQNYPIAALVAFSGEVVDKDSGPDSVTENSTVLNPGLKGRDIRDAFDSRVDGQEEYQVLLVANKFQTGFDQPLLCGMYVDRRLDGIQAVQTLSRLNRAYSGPYGLKDTTFVLDFANDADAVLEAFRLYYETAALEDVTDPNLIFNMWRKLDATGYYDEPEVDRVAAVEVNPRSTQGELQAAIYPVADRLVRQYKAAGQRKLVADEARDAKTAEGAKGEMEALSLFKRDILSFSNTYTFLSQIFDYASSALEKRFVFYKRLYPLLDFQRERDEIDLSKVVLTHFTIPFKGKRNLALSGGEGEKLKPLTEAGTGAVQEREKAMLSEIIAKVNDLFGADTTEGDRLVYVNSVLKGKLLESETLRQQAATNTKEQFSNSPDLLQELVNAIMDAQTSNTSLSKQALESEKVMLGLKDVLLGPVRLYEALRKSAESQAE